LKAQLVANLRLISQASAELSPSKKSLGKLLSKRQHFFFGCLGENAFNYLGKMQTSDYRWHITHYIHRYIFR